MAILAVGSAMQRVVPAPAGGFETASYMNVTLSCDHRVRCRIGSPAPAVLKIHYSPV